MRLLASVMTGVVFLFGVGLLTGTAPRPTVVRKYRPSLSDRQLWLTQAGVDLTPRQFWAASLAVGLLAFLLFLLLTGIPIIAAVPAIGVGMLPRAYFARQRNSRLSEVLEAWPDGLRDITASISSGMSLPRAVETLASKGPDPLRRAFDRYGLLARTIGVVPALETVKEELGDPTSDRVIEVLILAHERGGNIVTEILTDLAEATTRDLWTLEDIRTAAIEQKINSRVVFVLPWFVLVALTAMTPAYRQFYASAAGFFVVLVGVVLSGSGILLVSLLSKEPQEERVLGGSARMFEEAR